MWWLALLSMGSNPPDGIKPNCRGSTLEINACLQDRLDRSQTRLERYIQAAIDRHTDADGKIDPVVLGIQSSQAAFEAYRGIECDSVYEEWKQGTIRDAMSLNCRMKLTDERAHVVWRNWLQFMDSTPPILPEPKATE
jgi:uncharacterized protein YecT (DUF1311 family)